MKCLEKAAVTAVKKDDYKKCREQFGKYLKRGERFSFKEYVDRMQEGRDENVEMKAQALRDSSKSDGKKLKSNTEEGLDIEDDDEKKKVPPRAGAGELAGVEEEAARGEVDAAEVQAELTVAETAATPGEVAEAVAEAAPPE